MGFLLFTVYRMGSVFQPSWECNFCNTSRTSDIPVKPFWIWGISIYLRNFESSEFVVILTQMKWSAQEFNLPDSKVALFDRQFQSCIANALEDCPKVPGKVRSVIGCDSNIIHVLSTMVSLDN